MPLRTNRKHGRHPSRKAAVMAPESEWIPYGVRPPKRSDEAAYVVFMPSRQLRRVLRNIAWREHVDAKS